MQLFLNPKIQEKKIYLFFSYICNFINLVNFYIMKTLFSIIFISLLISASLKAQNCEAYIPTKVGQKLMFQTSNKKGKIQSYYSQELLSKKDKDGGTAYEIIQISYDTSKKRKITNQDTLEFLCKDNTFYIDMNTFLNEEQMKAYDESQITIDFKNISYPANLKPGMTLDDGYVKAEINAGIPIVFKTDITNRKAESYETITTLAGNFETIKVSQDVSAKFGFITVKMHTVNWVKKNIGNVKSESYDKNDNLISVTELISIE